MAAWREIERERDPTHTKCETCANAVIIYLLYPALVNFRGYIVFVQRYIKGYYKNGIFIIEIRKSVKEKSFKARGLRSKEKSFIHLLPVHIPKFISFG